MTLKNVHNWDDLIYKTRVGQLGVAHLDVWDLYFRGSFDDAGVRPYFDVYDHRERNEGRLQWTVLLFLRIQDYIGSGDKNFKNFEVRINLALGRTPLTTKRPPDKRISNLQLHCERVDERLRWRW